MRLADLTPFNPAEVHAEGKSLRATQHRSPPPALRRRGGNGTQPYPREPVFAEPAGQGSARIAATSTDPTATDIFQGDHTLSAETQESLDSFNCRRTLKVNGKSYTYYSLVEAEKNGLKGISRLPYSMKVLLENLLRFEDGRTVKKDDISGVAAWLENTGSAGQEIGFRPARVLMQDFTGVPAVVDLAAMRDGMTRLEGDPKKINPLVPVDLVIDHSVIVDEFGTPKALSNNVELEYARNGERYKFLKWGQGAFDNFRVVPPGTGICHQVNLEYLAQTVWTKDVHGGDPVAYPVSLGGTDSQEVGQRSCRSRLGCGRHRGRGGNAGPAVVDADPRSDRLQADRQTQ